MLHEPREESKGIVFDKVRVEHLDHHRIGHGITDALTVDSILVHDIEEGSEELVHALPVAAQVWVQLDPYEEDVQDEGLGGLLVVEGLIWQALDILQDLAADQLVLAGGCPW